MPAEYRGSAETLQRMGKAARFPRRNRIFNGIASCRCNRCIFKSIAQ